MSKANSWNTTISVAYRTGSTNAPLTVNYAIGGAATNGVDYNTLSGSATIPAGSVSAQILITPIDDAILEGNETVVLTLSTNSAYNLGSPSSVTVAIADNDTPIPPPRLENLLRLSSGVFQFSLRVDPGRMYVLEASTNLVDWTALVTNTSPATIFDFTDYAATNHTYRFYRLKNP